MEPPTSGRRIGRGAFRRNWGCWTLALFSGEAKDAGQAALDFGELGTKGLKAGVGLPLADELGGGFDAAADFVTGEDGVLG